MYSITGIGVDRVGEFRPRSFPGLVAGGHCKSIGRLCLQLADDRVRRASLVDFHPVVLVSARTVNPVLDVVAEDLVSTIFVRSRPLQSHRSTLHCVGNWTTWLAGRVPDTVASERSQTHKTQRQNYAFFFPSFWAITSGGSKGGGQSGHAPQSGHN